MSRDRRLRRADLAGEVGDDLLGGRRVSGLWLRRAVPGQLGLQKGAGPVEQAPDRAIRRRSGIKRRSTELHHSARRGQGMGDQESLDAAGRTNRAGSRYQDFGRYGSIHPSALDEGEGR